MNKYKVFIDGSAGTTGLRIFDRLESRDDIELLKLCESERKEISKRKEMINKSDITFLCLPDDASRESVSLVENGDTVIIDTSTAHRTESGWAYGFPELSKEMREKIRQSKRVAVPGCHASGFNAIVYPLVAKAAIPSDYPVSCFSLSGYSGAGKKAIAEYESDSRPEEYSSPRLYALAQHHKHLKEMKFISSLASEPVFSPVICDYYSGMAVTVPLHTKLMNGNHSVDTLFELYADFFKGEKLIKVIKDTEGGFLGSNNLSCCDGMEIHVNGNEERVTVCARFDNLGKGASGAAVQCMNIVMGCEETKGLVQF
ncbi:MAG: N-acetyl-gamma-glutamyl-phosphate reductase [Clostridia bacterium]|nr:N-acetyl-gamma-glutamyl-phosphate reductase [Clostridia bacterium]